MRQTEYRRRNTALTEEIFEELQKVSQDELNWLFRQIRYKVRRLDGQRMKVTTGSPRLQKSYIVSGNLWDFFVSRMRSSLMRAWVKGAIKLATLQRNHFTSFKPVEFDPEEFAKFIEPELGERIVGVTKTIKRQVGAKVVGWYNSPGTTMQSLVDQLKPTFGEKRARLIAQTEVTRLNSEVKRLTADQIGATEWWWSTRRDNLVCVKPLKGPDGKVYKGCRELHGKTFDIGYLMPPDGSHPGCRCDPVLVPPRRTATAQTRPVIEGLLKFDENQPRDEEGKWTDTGKGGKASGAKPKALQEALDNYLNVKPNSPEERAFDSVMDRIYDARRDYHNENTPENLDYLIGSCRSSRSDKERIAALVTMQELPFNEDGTVTLYRGGNLGGQSWSTDKEWATRFAVYGFGAGGEKRKGGTKLYRKDFTVDQLVVALPWEGEVIVNKEAATDAEEIPIEYPRDDKAEEWIEGKVDDKSTEQLTLKTVADDDEKYEIPMPAIDNESRTAAKSYLASLSSDEKEAQYKTEELNISDLHSGQPSVRKETVDYFLNGGKPGWLEEFIRVARVNGKLYLMNGNHRVVASMLQGAERVKAKVIDIPALTKADFVESEHPRDEDGKFTDKGTGVSGGGSEPAYKQAEEYKEFTAAIERYNELTDPYDKMDALRDAENAAFDFRKEMREDYFDGEVPEFFITAYKKGSGTDIGEIVVFTDFEKAKESLQEGETLKAFDVEANTLTPIDKQSRTCITDGAYLRDERPVDLSYQPPENVVTYKLADTDYNEGINQVFNLLKIPEAVEKYNVYHNFIKMKPKVTPTEYVEECEKRLKKAIEDTDVCVRLPVASLNKVLEQGSYKSVFESQKSGAGGFAGGIWNRERYLKIRRRAENQMFGISEAQETDRPVYGYLAGKGSVNPNSEDLEQYGNVALVLKDSVRERTTFTQGDSLDDVNMKGIFGHVLPNGQKIWSGKGSPSKVTDPKIQSLTYLEYWSGRDWLTNAELYEEKPEEDNNAVPQKERKYGYWEAQVSSGFSVDEIASVAFIGKEPGSKTTKALDKLGIPWKVVEGYVEKMLKADQPNGVLIARNDYLALYALDGETGYVVNIETGKRYPTHMLASILSRGYWEMVEDEDLTKWDEQKHPRDEDGKWTDGGGSKAHPKGIINHERIESVSRSHSSFETFQATNDKPKFVEELSHGIAEGVGIEVGIKILDDKEFNEKFKNAKISPEAAMMGGASVITAGYNSLENTIYLRRSGIDKIANWKEFSNYRAALYHEMGHAYHANVYGITKQDKGEYGSGWAEQFADEFAGALAYAEQMWRYQTKPSPFPKENERAKTFDFKSHFTDFINSNKPVKKLEKWDEQKHPRKKDGKFAPNGMGETGGQKVSSETRAEFPENDKSRSNPSVAPETGTEVEGRPQMGRNFDITPEAEMIRNGNYTDWQQQKFEQRRSAVEYASRTMFNDELSQKDYIDKYIRRGWKPTNEDRPYLLVNPEGTRQREVSRQGMKDYLDVVLNRGEYKANYDLPEGADVVPAPKAVPERVAKPKPEPAKPEPKPEPVSYPDGASVAKVLASYVGEYDKNNEEVKKRERFVATAKLELEKYGEDELRDENNKEAQRALEQYTRAMTYLKIEIDTQKNKARYEKGLELTHVDDPVKMNPKLSPEFKGKKIYAVKNGVQAFENIVSARTGLRVTNVRFDLRPKGRSSYNHDNLRVTLSKQEMILTDAIIHELGHHLEFEAPGVRIAAQKFFQKRTQGEKTVPMNKYHRGYRPDEVCKPDKFIDPYVGKVYSDGSTEIISVGLAAYYTDPAQFAKDDPEHFALIYDAVHGKFSNNL